MTQTGTPTGLAVGLDLVRVSSVVEAIQRYGDRYLQRLFTAHELASCPGDPVTRAAGLAARLAAKEATLKVLRPRDHPGADDDGIPPWTSIEVVRHADGWCSLSLHREAARLKEAAGLLDLSVSMTHEEDMAAAVVVGLRWPTTEPGGTA
jgi:holo-[acyl-carrier protein] synthase